MQKLVENLDETAEEADPFSTGEEDLQKAMKWRKHFPILTS